MGQIIGSFVGKIIGDAIGVLACMIFCSKKSPPPPGMWQNQCLCFIIINIFTLQMCDANLVAFINNSLKSLIKVTTFSDELTCRHNFIVVMFPVIQLTVREELPSHL